LRSRKLSESAWILPSSIVTLSIDFYEEKTLLLLPFLIEENFPSSSEKIRIRDVQAGKFCEEKDFKFFCCKVQRVFMSLMLN
jgi:hypothetical protein